MNGKSGTIENKELSKSSFCLLCQLHLCCSSPGALLSSVCFWSSCMPLPFTLCYCTMPSPASPTCALCQYSLQDHCSSCTWNMSTSSRAICCLCTSTPLRCQGGDTAHLPLPTAHLPLPTAHLPLPTAHLPGLAQGLLWRVAQA